MFDFRSLHTSIPSTHGPGNELSRALKNIYYVNLLFLSLNTQESKKRLSIETEKNSSAHFIAEEDKSVVE